MQHSLKLCNTSYAIKSHFVNSLISKGRKLKAEKTFHDILCQLKKFNSNFYQFDIFYYSLISLKPLISLRTIKVGSTPYKVAVPANYNRGKFYAIKFLFSASKSNRGSLSFDKLMQTIKSIYVANKNLASEKKFFLYREALENRVFIKKMKYESL